MVKRNGPVALYELNEVPWRVIDWYVQRRPDSEFARIQAQSETFTSVTKDTGDLHPWVTWPTVHRSVYNTTHGIAFINQDLAPAAAYPPIWERIASAGKRVGVFGSLQSYPPPKQDHASYAFYVPDTFSPGPETVPARYSCFQRLNLRQTAADRATAKDVSLSADAVRDLAMLFFNGLSIKTMARLALQLMHERSSSLHRQRRPMLQAPVAFDVFKHALRRAQPDFCTFFTNHVAGIMHRYWKYAFPEDFGYVNRSESDGFHAESLLIAMDHADEQLAFLRRWVDRRNGILYVASSMGQEAVQQEQEQELFIDDMRKFIGRLRVDCSIEPRMAMHPDYSFSFQSATDAVEFARRLTELRRKDGKPIFFNIELAGTTVGASAGSGSGFGFGDGRACIYVGDEAEAVPLAEFGLAYMQRDVGTGYHQPKGSLFRYGSGVVANGDRGLIESIQIAGMILQDLGIVNDAQRPSDLADKEPMGSE